MNQIQVEFVCVDLKRNRRYIKSKRGTKPQHAHTNIRDTDQTSIVTFLTWFWNDGVANLATALTYACNRETQGCTQHSLSLSFTQSLLHYKGWKLKKSWSTQYKISTSTELKEEVRGCCVLCLFDLCRQAAQCTKSGSSSVCLMYSLRFGSSSMEGSRTEEGTDFTHEENWCSFQEWDCVQRLL